MHPYGSRPRLNLEVLRDVIWVDPSDHDVDHRVDVIKEALDVNLHDGPELLEASLDPLQVLVFAREVHQRDGLQPRLVEDKVIG